MRVTKADLIRNPDVVFDRARAEPVTVTQDGRDEMVLLPTPGYLRLKRRDRLVRRAEDVTDEEAALIEKSEAPAEYAHLDALLDENP